jgi:hypothetical protein
MKIIISLLTYAAVPLPEHLLMLPQFAAVRRIPRRLDHDARQVKACGPPALRRERAANRVHAAKHVGEKMRR